MSLYDQSTIAWSSAPSLQPIVRHLAHRKGEEAARLYRHLQRDAAPPRSQRVRRHQVSWYHVQDWSGSNGHFICEWWLHYVTCCAAYERILWTNKTFCFFPVLLENDTSLQPLASCLSTWGNNRYMLSSCSFVSERGNVCLWEPDCMLQWHLSVPCIYISAPILT